MSSCPTRPGLCSRLTACLASNLRRAPVSRVPLLLAATFAVFVAQPACSVAQQPQTYAPQQPIPASSLQAPASSPPADFAPQPPNAPQPAAASIAGIVTDTDAAAVATARITLEDAAAKVIATVPSDATGAFLFPSLSPGTYIVRIAAPGFAAWRIKDILVLHDGENFLLPTVELGVEEINTTVNAITMEVLAERQITAEEHQRILGVLPNFYVSYLPNAAPLTRKLKFNLALHVSTDPLTFMVTGINAGIEQWQGDYSSYGSGFSGYATRFGAAYGDRFSATMLGSAILPSLLHQDPRYFYRGHGNVVVRALYAISTTAVCKGDNGHWQPNVSNIGGNLGAAFISSTYYPREDRHSVQVTVSNTLLGIAEGSISTLFQEFLLRHFTHGVPASSANSASSNRP